MCGASLCLWELLGGCNPRACHALQHNKCINSSISHYAGIFPTNNETVSVDIYQGVSATRLCPVSFHSHLGDMSLSPSTPGAGGDYYATRDLGADGNAWGRGHFRVPTGVSLHRVSSWAAISGQWHCTSGASGSWQQDRAPQ